MTAEAKKTRRAPAGKSRPRIPKKSAPSRARSRKSRKKIALSTSQTISICLAVVVVCFASLMFNARTADEKAQSVSLKRATEQKAPGLERDASAEKNQGQFSEPKKLEIEKNSSRAEKIARSEAASEKPTEERKAARLAVEAASLPSKPQSQKKPAEKSPAAQPSGAGEKKFPQIPRAAAGAKLVFVFDDAGQSAAQLQKYLALSFPVSIAVLPRLPRSKECADAARAAGAEVLLHQPMQAINLNVNPGAGAITPEMRASEISDIIKANIAEIGPVAGMNNHEGSLITEDELKIGAAMQAAKDCGAYFLDSRTTSQTRAAQASMELGIPYYSRDVFLDNSRDRDAIVSEILRALGVANKNGCAIMIGHVWSADILPGILSEMYPALRDKGYKFATVSASGALKETMINPNED